MSNPRKKKATRASRSPKGTPVQKINAERPEARDEGPRLIPLSDDGRRDPMDSSVQHYADLADVLLNPKPKSSARIKRTIVVPGLPPEEPKR